MMMKSSKKSIIISAVSVTTVAAIIALVALFSGCGSSDTATADEATKSVISTSDEVATLATLSDTDQAIVDNGLTVNEKGDIVDKDGKKVEPSEDGKVTIKDADGKEIKVDTDSVKIANTNKAQVETTNAAIQSANSNSSSKSNSSATVKSNTSSNSSKSNSSSDGNSSKSNSSNKNTSNSKSNTSSSSKNNTSSNNNSSSKQEAPKVEATKHTHSWQNITQQVKVVDQEAYAKEEPVYESKWRTICNDCDADITDNLEHIFEHIDNDPNCKGSYRNQRIQIQTSTETIEVPEEYHYETEVIGHKCTSCGETEYY